MTEKIILGIDPGTNIMGYGVLKVQGKQAEMLALGVIDLRKYADHYLKLGHIFERVSGIIDAYLPDEMAIEAPFFGKNVQSMLKLGRSQGVAMAAAIHHPVPIAHQNQDGHHGQRQCPQGAGGRHASTHAEALTRGNGQVPRCNGCLGSCLLPFPADGPP